MPAHNTIYQDLWSLDLNHNGCTVSARTPSGDWVDPGADILLDEQHETVRADRAPGPLFAHVSADNIAGPTYRAFISLLDNYIVNAAMTEDHLGDNQVEDAEIVQFLDTILPTPVMQRALAYTRDTLGLVSDEADLRAALMRMWFEIYTNHYNNNAVSNVSGFEHVMVGEGHGSGHGIGGYHSWVKFYLDEQSGRVDFRGYNYDGTADRSAPAGARFPSVATISLTWDQQDIHGNVVKVLNKDQGGFFVGPSPELQIAIGTVAYFESVKGGFFTKSGGNEQTVIINGARYNLVMYRSTTQDQQRGDKIRSYFPKFLSPLQSTDTDIVIEETDEVAVINDGVIRILRAMPNPEGSDDGTEWVVLENNGAAILHLDGWSLADRLDRREPLSGILEPGKSRKIFISRSDPNGMMMSNGGGEILVHDAGDAIVARVGYRSVPSGMLLHFVTA